MDKKLLMSIGTAAAIILVVVAIATGVFNTGTKQQAAVLGIQPNSGRFAANQEFTVEVWLDTVGNAADGVDVLLRFDPAVIEPTNISFEDSVLPIQAGVNPTSVQRQDGLIRFSSLATPGSTYDGQGKIAEVTFMPRTTGQVGLSFEHELGKTTDSNVSAQGADILRKVENATYEIF